MIIPTHAVIIMLAAATFLSLYYTLLKKFSGNIILLYFWVHLTSYAVFSLMYLFKQSVFLFNIQALEHLVFDFTYTNFPLYLISAACLLLSHLIVQKLICCYPIATIIGVSQVSILLSALGYKLLGDHTSMIALIGVSVICIGALISGLSNFSIKKPLKSFASYDKSLLKLCMAYALCTTITALITYLCTAQYSDITKSILHHLTKHLHVIPFAPLTPIHFNIGVQCANMLLLFLYINYHLHKTGKISTIIKQNYKIILQISGMYVLYGYCFYTGFDLIKNKNLVAAILKLYLPLTLVFSYLLLAQKPTKEQIAGMSIIILGSGISMFA